MVAKCPKQIEYRGYDSAGLTILEKKIIVYKTKGKTNDLENYIANKNTEVFISIIIHTRWTTHGEPNEIYTHPHLSRANKLTLIHNGIFENF
jgi:glucosamine--fructose-6-phosphate aminotransferase (isomerizing)